MNWLTKQKQKHWTGLQDVAETWAKMQALYFGSIPHRSILTCKRNKWHYRMHLQAEGHAESLRAWTSWDTGLNQHQNNIAKQLNQQQISILYLIVHCVCVCVCVCVRACVRVSVRACVRVYMCVCVQKWPFFFFFFSFIIFFKFVF